MLQISRPQVSAIFPQNSAHRWRRMIQSCSGRKKATAFGSFSRQDVEEISSARLRAASPRRRFACRWETQPDTARDHPISHLESQPVKNAPKRLSRQKGSSELASANSTTFSRVDILPATTRQTCQPNSCGFLPTNCLGKVEFGKRTFSRMRSEGFSFDSSGVWGFLVLFATRSGNRCQPFATVRSFALCRSH